MEIGPLKLDIPPSERFCIEIKLQTKNEVTYYIRVGASGDRDTIFVAKP